MDFTFTLDNLCLMTRLFVYYLHIFNVLFFKMLKGAIQ